MATQSELIKIGSQPKLKLPPPLWSGDESQLNVRFREEYRSRFLHSKSLELLTKEETAAFEAHLERFASAPTAENGDKMILYSDYLQSKSGTLTKLEKLLTPHLFALLLEDDPFGRVSIRSIVNYTTKLNWLRESRLALSLYDHNGNGYLTERDLEAYIADLMPTIMQLDALSESFQSFYICTAVRRFMFFLDNQKKERARIVDVLASGFLDEFVQLREDENTLKNAPSQSDPCEPKSVDTSGNKMDNDPLENSHNSTSDGNWFSAVSALKVYAQYLDLDADKNGLLSRKELLNYEKGTLTDVFVDRLFEETQTYDGEMDYKGYLDFVLAMENMKDSASLSYFFRILDVNRQGYLDAFSLNYFFRAIQEQLSEDDMVSFSDMKDEIFDMIRPKNPSRITLSDVISSKQGDTLVSLLIDLDGFWRYENREILATEGDDNEED